MGCTPLIVMEVVIVAYANHPIPYSPLDFAEDLGCSFFNFVAPDAGGMIKFFFKDRRHSWKHPLPHHHLNPLQ